jgi:hypothetical protein
MKHPIITDYDRLSNLTIKVYAFHIILYFYMHPYLKKQSQFSPFFAQKRGFHKKQTQLKPIYSELVESIQSQFVERPKMKALAWKMNHTIILIVLLADFTNLKVANFKAKQTQSLTRKTTEFEDNLD